MTLRWRISIRSKILLVLSAVVISAVALYLYLASKIFYEDKTLLIYELNQTNVRTLGGEVEQSLKSVLEHLQIWALHGDPQIKSDPDWVRIGIIEKNPETGALTEKALKTWPESIEVFGKNESFLAHVREQFPIPFSKVLESGIWVKNVTLPPEKEGDENNPQIIPMVTVAAVIKRPPPLSDAVIFADLKLDRIIGVFSNEGIASTYLVDSEGYPLALADHKKLVRPSQMNSDPLISAATHSKLRSEVRRFEQNENTYLGSFYRLAIPGMVVASKVELKEAYSAAMVLVRKSIVYALLVITAAFLIALIFSYSLTIPIQRMVKATRQIAQGNFNLSVPISSSDELALLATSFNKMTRDLRSSRDELQEYSRTLEKKVDERTLAMREAQDTLLRTTRLASVGEVAGRAAHEVLNPLTNITTRIEKIRNFSAAEDGKDLALFQEIVAAWNKETQAGPEQLLKTLSAPSTALPGKTLLQEDVENLSAVARDLSARLQTRRADLEFLLKESDRISKIVNGMRQLTRVASSRKQVRAHAIIDETVAAMNDLFQKNEIQIEKGYCEGNPQILADHDELLQVFSNLFRNSLQAIQEARRSGAALGSPARVWITTQIINIGSDGGKTRLYIRIHDNGPGIPAESAQAIFEPSFTTKSPEEGTGLGLSICRRFIRALDGEISLEKSVPGVETSMLITLPHDSTLS